MFIELTIKSPSRGLGISSAQKAFVRADDIVLVRELQCEEKEDALGDSYTDDEYESMILLATGDSIPCIEDREEVYARIVKLDRGAASYSVTMEGSGFSTTTMVPTK